MKLKFVLIILTLSVILGGIGLFNTKSQGKVQDKLSNRALEYLDQQKKIHASGLGNVDPHKTDKDIVGQQNINSDCFSIHVPFIVTRVKEEEKCSYTIFITEPKGTIVVYDKEENIASVDEDSGVLLRRRNPDLYNEERKIIGINPYDIFTKKDGTLEKTAFFSHNGKLFILSLNSPTNGIFSKQFEEMLKSIRFNNGKQ